MYYAVIMAGGSGTRLWPLSREHTPKQALRLLGERSLFQMAVDRLDGLFPPERILVITRAEHAAALREQAPQLPAGNFIEEPEGRGTGPAIGLAALHVQQRDPQAVMAVLTADHNIADVAGFQRALRAAQAVALQGHLVTLGITPGFAATGYGYIERGATLPPAEGLPAYRLARFVEKPDPETARRMFASGEYAWNSGMFIWQIERIMQEFERQMPNLFAALQTLRPHLGGPAYADTLRQTWPGVQKQTIDYGVMEGARDAAVLPVEIGWADVGSWASVYELMPADERGNRWTGPHLAFDTADTLAVNTERLVALIGVSGLVVVDTPDALLICPREREQEVKQIVERLRKDGQTGLL